MHLKELDANLVVVLDALLIDASVTKAAERLGRSPSAVSHALANLRHIFDDDLFVRAGQRLAPTSKAKELAPTVHIIVSGLESLLRPSAPFDPATQERTFMIACSEMAELYLLAPLREILQEEAPDVLLERVLPESSTFLDDLRQGRIDFALIEGEFSQTLPDVQWTLLKRDAYVSLIKAAGDGQGGQGKVGQEGAALSLAALQERPHILSHVHSNATSELELLLLEHRIPQENIYKVGSSLLGQLMAFDMAGVVTVPDLHAAVMGRHVSSNVVDSPFALPSIDVKLGWHRSFDRDECHSWLREKIQSRFEGEGVASE